MALNKKAAGADGGVIDFIAGMRLHELHEQTDDFAGGVEFTALLPGAVGKILDQIFVGGSKQIGKFEVIIDQNELRLIEVVEEVFPLLIGDFGLPFDGVEIDVVLQTLHQARRSHPQWPRWLC